MKNCLFTAVKSFEVNFAALERIPALPLQTGYHQRTFLWKIVSFYEFPSRVFQFGIC
jgi:hypothetical protein